MLSYSCQKQSLIMFKFLSSPYWLFKGILNSILDKNLSNPLKLKCFYQLNGKRGIMSEWSYTIKSNQNNTDTRMVLNQIQNHRCRDALKVTMFATGMGDFVHINKQQQKAKKKINAFINLDLIILGKLCDLSRYLLLYSSGHKSSERCEKLL